MALISTSALRKITILVFVVAVVSFGATEIHKRLIVPRQQAAVTTLTTTPTKDWNAPPEGFKESLPGSHYFPSDEQVVEGVVVDSKTDYLTLDTNGQKTTFYKQQGSFYATPDDGEEITTRMGRKMRIYYEGRGGKFYLVFGEYL